MNQDQVKGKVKDVAGRVERQAGEWAGDTETQVKGAAKQAEGKVQKAWGDVKDATNKAVDREKADNMDRHADDSADDEASRRKAS